MSDRSKIAWTDATWNPIRGCSPVSGGCANCWAAQYASRFAGKGLPFAGLATGGKWTGEVRFLPKALDQPLRWRRPRRVFVSSISDLFHERLSYEQIAAVYGVMAGAPHHTYQVLTKRPGRMREWYEWFDAHYLRVGWSRCAREQEWPLRSVWLGVSVENQATANARIPPLLATPAAVRWVSYEPALGPVDFTPWLHPAMPCIDWIVCGCESGPHGRPMDLKWARDARDVAAAGAAAFFFKQARIGGRVVSLPELDGLVWKQYPQEAPRE